MAKGKSSDVLDRVFAKAGRGKRVRSALAKVLTTDHDQFSARLASAEAEGAPYNWDDLAAGFRDQGYTDGDGNRLTGDRLRRTWARVSERVRVAREKAGHQPVPTSPGPIRNAAPALVADAKPAAPNTQFREGETAAAEGKPRRPAPTPTADPMAQLRSDMNKRSGRED